MMVKRVVTALITCVIVLIGALGVVGAGVPGAWAESGLTVTATPDNPFASSSTHFLRVSAGTGNVAYCAQGWLICPKVGQSLERYGSLGIPELDYVMWHGYDGSVVRSLYGLDAKRSEAATALAVWLAIADQRGDVLSYHERDGSSYHGNKGYRERWELQSDARVKEAAWKLYQEAIDYKNKGGNGPERNCSTLWINKTPVFVGGKPAFDYQSLITVEKDVSVKFSKVSADVSITAGNGSYPLAGAEYDIFREKDDRKVASIVTDEQGEAVVRLSPNTKYYAIETKAPAGFALSEKRVEFETGLKDSEVEIADRPGTVKIVVSKKDIATLAGPQPGASLSGAEFTVTSKSTAGWSKTGTTDEDGVVTFSGIPLGDIAIVETKAPEGYRIDPTVHEYHVDPSDTGDQKDVELIPENDFLETPLACDIEIAKFNDEGVEGSKVEEPAEGVSFEIISGTTGKVVGTITTNHEGIASTKGEWFGEGSREESIQGALPYDRAGYRVREVPETVPEGFERVDDWTIDREAMVDGTTLHFIVNNSRITSRLRLEKRDAETGGVIPLPGFTFQVLDKDGKPVSMEIWHPFHEMIDTFTTDETGTVTLPEPLPTGSYSIHELAAPAPYLIPETDTPFEIKEGSSTGGITVVSIRDEAAKGRATIEKTCSLDGTSLAGAEFDVVACEDIRAADGSIQVQKGSVFEHVETDERGVAVIDNLPLGSGSARYAFIETVPPKGHALDRTPYEFTVSYRDPSTEVVTTSVEAENEPTTVIVSKIDGQDGSALAEATFQIWRKEDEVAAKPSDGMGSIVIDAGKQVSSVQMDPIPTHAELLVEAPDDVSVAIRDDKGQDMRGGRGALLAPGCHTIECHDGSNGGEKAEFPLTLEAGRRYDVRISRSLFGLTCDVIDEAPISDMFDLVDEDGDGVFSSTEIPPGSYRVGIDGNDCATIEIEQGETHYMKFANGKIKTVPIVLKDGATPPSFTTDQEGTVSIPHLEPGSYRMVEIKCPKGYVMTDQVETFIVTMDGLINGAPRKEIVVANNRIKVDVSKRDAETEDHIPGAHLKIEDAHGDVVDEWTSDGSPHRIDRIAAGTYTLVEERGPKAHDVAPPLAFTIRQVDEVQTVTMYDQPIVIEGEVDKRQEIARPVSPDTLPNGDGANRAEPTDRENGRYLYSIDARNASGTWVDEFTVEDTIAGAREGVVELERLITPQAWQDHDGLMNVWYKTNLMYDGEIEDANATLDDGHVNPWLHDPSTVKTLGDDGRAVDYTGWELWRAGVDSTFATDLDVSDLDLEEGERVTAVRFEYGRVEKGFATRPDGWDRDDLKHLHDDVDSVQNQYQGTFVVDGDTTRHYAPALLEMRVNDGYRDGIPLDNAVDVHVYRNGGGEGLEDHDNDRVTQTNETRYRRLDQTGITHPAPLVLIAGLCATAAVTMRLRRR